MNAPSWLMWNGTYETNVDIGEGILYLGEELDRDGLGYVGTVWSFVHSYAFVRGVSDGH